jgi:ech hydrogenase subunit C
MKLVRKSRKKSPWVLIFDCGGCNGCAIEMKACFTPRYDIERFGCLFKGSPRHADILFVYGTVNTKSKEVLKKLYTQMANPKVVVGVGSCSQAKGIFKDCYNVTSTLDEIIPVDVFVPGCPPKPEAIISGLLKAMKKLEEKK